MLTSQKKRSGDRKWLAATIGDQRKREEGLFETEKEETLVLGLVRFELPARGALMGGSRLTLPTKWAVCWTERNIWA